MDIDMAKKQACMLALEMVKDGQVLGLGTGSTIKFAVIELGKRCSEGQLSIVGVPTSLATEKLAREVGVPLTTISEVGKIDLTIDGADEVSPDFQLIKGMGGALTREKIIAQASRSMAVVIDETKNVATLGTKSPLPVEVVVGYEDYLIGHLEGLTGAKATLRTREDKTYYTDNGNPIIDLRFESINEPQRLAVKLSCTAGVVEHGLFLDIAKRVFVGDANGGGYEKDLA